MADIWHAVAGSEVKPVASQQDADPAALSEGGAATPVAVPGAGSQDDWRMARVGDALVWKSTFGYSFVRPESSLIRHVRNIRHDLTVVEVEGTADGGSVVFAGDGTEHTREAADAVALVVRAVNEVPGDVQLVVLHPEQPSEGYQGALNVLAQQLATALEGPVHVNDLGTVVAAAGPDSGLPLQIWWPDGSDAATVRTFMPVATPRPVRYQSGPDGLILAQRPPRSPATVAGGGASSGLPAVRATHPTPHPASAHHMPVAQPVRPMGRSALEAAGEVVRQRPADGDDAVPAGADALATADRQPTVPAEILAKAWSPSPDTPAPPTPPSPADPNMASDVSPINGGTAASRASRQIAWEPRADASAATGGGGAAPNGDSGTASDVTRSRPVDTSPPEHDNVGRMVPAGVVDSRTDRNPVPDRAGGSLEDAGHGSNGAADPPRIRWQLRSVIGNGTARADRDARASTPSAAAGTGKADLDSAAALGSAATGPTDTAEPATAGSRWMLWRGGCYAG